MVRRKQKKAIQAQDVGSSSLSNTSARTTSATDGAHFLLTAMGRALPDLSDIRDVEHLQKCQASRSDETISSILDHLAQLKKLVLPEDSLESHDYALHSLNGDELENKKRCQGCGKTMSQFRKRAREMKKPRKEPEPERSAGFPTQGVLEGGNEGCARDDPSTGKTQGPILRCKFHVGVLENKLWSCCGQRPSAPPCSGSEHHIPRQYPPGAFERSWQIWPTPIPKSLKKIRLAVAIDCEMGTAASGDSELIRVTLVDYFTSDVLVDDLVFPDVPMRELRTRFSGVTWSALQNARRKGKCIFGRDNARKAVWEFVGPNTIVVGHSAHHDLLALRWAHRAIVDTYQLEALKPPKTNAKIASDGEQPAANLNADTSPAPACGSEQKREPKRPSPMSLKGLALAKLGRDIQTAGKQGHDSLEDAIATRDLARWVVCTSQGWDGDAECLPSTDMLGG